MYYKLDEHDRPVKCADVLEWARWFEEHKDKRRVDSTIIGSLRVSTVFLAIDHNFGWDGPPVLYETMVFDKDGISGDWDKCARRYTTLMAARTGHIDIVSEIQDSLVKAG